MANDPPNPQAPTGDALDSAFIRLRAYQKLEGCHRGHGELRTKFGACSAGDKSAAAAEEAKHGLAALRPTSSVTAAPV